MEYEEENGGPGSTPALGAIFMSNNETKMECFRQNILALPPSYANFVKKVKKGMVLFLFEFERRQLFGVYRAVSDGGMNISRSPFHFSGRHFPAQVRFTTLWKCTPLCEKEFREAIRENYYAPKKFNFGLSQVQVSHLLKLFNSRRLPPKQLGIDTRSAGNDQRRISIRDRLKTRDFEDDSPQMEMSEFLTSSTHTAIESNDNMLFVDDRVNTGKDINCSGENYSTEQVGDSLCQRKRAYDNDAGCYDPDAPVLSFRTDDHDVNLGKERGITACGGFNPTAKVSEHGFSVYAGIGTNYPMVSLDVNRITDYERTEFGSTNTQPFDGIDTLKSRLNSHGAFGYASSDELDDVHKRTERKIRLGRHDYNMDDNNANPMFASKIYDDSQQFVNGKSGRSNHMMDRGMGTQQNLDTGLGFDLVSEKLQNSFDIGQRINEERRLASGSEVMNANGIGGTHSSTISYNPSEYSGLQYRKDGDNFISSVRKADFPSSLDRISTSYLDSGSSQLNNSQNIPTSNSAYHDLVVTRTSDPECPTTYSYRHSPSAGIVNQDAGSDHRFYYSGGRGGEFCDRFGTSASGEKNFHPGLRDLDHPYAVSQCTELRPPAPTLNISAQFTPPSTHGSSPFTDYENFCPKRVSPLSSQNRSFLHEMESDIYWQERNSGDEVLPSITNLSRFGYHREKYLTSEGFGHSKLHSKHTTVNDDGQHLNPGGVHPDSQRHRISVFSRMGRTPKAQREEESEKYDTYLNASVDEIMDMLTSHQNVRSRDHRKSKPVVRQHGRDEVGRTDVQASPEPAKRFLATTKIDASSVVIADGVNEFPEETRGVGFKRRRNLKNMSAENSPKATVIQNLSPGNAVSEGTGPVYENTPKTTVLKNTSIKNAVSEGPVRENTPKTTILENTSIENAVSEDPVHKPQRRRKLSRPNFGSGASVDAVTLRNLDKSM